MPNSNVYDFLRVAKALGRAGGNLSLAAEFAAEESGGERASMVLRSAVGSGTVENAAYAGALVGWNTLAAGFIESLRAASVVDRLMADNTLRRIPLRTRLAVSTIAAAGAQVGEGMPVPVSALAFNGQGLAPAKAQALIVITSELAKAATSAGNALLATELRNGVGAACDSVFLGGITAGAQAVAGSNAPLTDLGEALAIANTTGNGRPYLVVDPHTANRLATKATTTGEQAFPGMSPNGGELAGVPVLVSDQVPAADSNGRKAVLLDATAIAGDVEAPLLDASEQAAVQMATNPATGAQELVSMFQSDSVALLATRWLGYQVIRASGVVVIEDVAW